MTKTALIPIASSIKKNTGYDALEVQPIKIVDSLEVAGFFMVSKDDEISLPERVEDMFKLYGGEPKQMYLMKGAHNESRSHDSKVAAAQFLVAVWKTMKPNGFNFRSLGNNDEESSENYDDTDDRETEENDRNDLKSNPGFYVDIEDEASLVTKKTGYFDQEALSSIEEGINNLNISQDD